MLATSPVTLHSRSEIRVPFWAPAAEDADASTARAIRSLGANRRQTDTRSRKLRRCIGTSGVRRKDQVRTAAGCYAPAAPHSCPHVKYAQHIEGSPGPWQGLEDQDAGVISFAYTPGLPPSHQKHRRAVSGWRCGETLSTCRLASRARKNRPSAVASLLRNRPSGSASRRAARCPGARSSGRASLACTLITPLVPTPPTVRPCASDANFDGYRLPVKSSTKPRTT